MNEFNKYKLLDEYLKLKYIMNQDNIFICDFSVGYIVDGNPENGIWIMISSILSPLEKLFTLSHEAGHLYCYPVNGIIKLNKKNNVIKLFGEEHANNFVKKYCKHVLKKSVARKYNEFYKKIILSRSDLTNYHSL